jgi:transposase-like protein
MAEHSGSSGRRRRKFLTPEQKYELWTATIRGDATQRQLADRWRVDRSTVIKACEVAKHGALSALAASRPGKPGAGHDPRDDELRDAREQIARLTEAVTEQAIELAVLRGKQRGAW